jgi:dTDP-4-amino-4,6-dideoxygalactose transaminase
LSNAFTFTAVPSAIVHCGAEPVYVDCEDNYILDLVRTLNSIAHRKVMHESRHLELHQREQSPRRTTPHTSHEEVQEHTVY